MSASADRAREREDLGEAKDVGHQQDQEHGEDDAQHVAVFVILLVTDILGFTKVFPFTRSIR